MSKPVHSKRGGWWVATAVGVVLMLLAYVGSYLVLARKTYWMNRVGPGRLAFRECRYPWMAGLYRPLAVLEEAITGDNIRIH